MKSLILLMVFIMGCSHMKKTLWVISPNPLSSNKEDLKKGRRLYEQHCLSCHGKKARGDGPQASSLESPPTDLVKSSTQRWQGTFAGIIAEGKAGGPEMPAFRGELSQKEIWQVTSYVYALKKVKITEYRERIIFLFAFR